MFNYLTAAKESPLGAISKYFVILESVTSVIFKNKSKTKKNLSPVEDPVLGKELIKDLTNVFNEFLNKNISKADTINSSILIQRIQKINEASNIDKLTESFDLVNIKLTNEDKKILKLRNKFLHGSFIESLDDASMSEEMYHIKTKLRTLIAALILKYYGHEGKITNYSYLFNSYTNRAASESIYITI